MHNWQAEGKTRMKAQLARANMLLTDTTMRTKTLLLARMHETQAFAGRTITNVAPNGVDMVYDD